MAEQIPFYRLCLREIRDLADDRWLLALVSWLPLALFAVLWYIFSQGVATELPLGIVDHDRSALSRELVRHYDMSSQLRVDDQYLSETAAVRALRAGRIYGLIILPRGLEEDASRGLPPTVTGFVNSQFLLTGKVVSSALTQAHNTFTARVEVGQAMVTVSPVPSQALVSVLPITSQITPLFNISKNYAQFLVSAILPAMWQIVMGAGAVLSMALSARKYTLAGWLGSGPRRSVLAKVAVLTAIFTGHGLGFLGFLHGWLGWPMRGDWSILVTAIALTALASSGIGCLVFLLQKDPARSLSLMTAYLAPGLAFMGVTFPTSDMLLPARVWRALIPVCHYIEVQTGQASHGAQLLTAVGPLQKLALLLLPLVCCLILAPRIAAVEPAGREAV